LADAVGYRVIATDGRDVGEVEHVRYRRYADHPDDVVIRRRVFIWHRSAIVPFDEIANVDPERERVYLRIPTGAIQRAPREYGR
jgi:sporulation protein YlmC with PRC-barrel domain